MNTSSSDLSSGCESGWTQYLVKSSSSPPMSRSMKMMCGDEYFEGERNNCYGGGEEDLSMVSDASSGPRQYNVEESYFNNPNEYCSNYPNNASESKSKKNKNGKQRDKSQLDDTASSHSKSKQPSMYYNNNNPSHGQENSAPSASLTKGRSNRRNYFGS